ncbi:uncharacterized protein LOC124200411 isoform X2 [Daphnia pulex]|uniref:uncharacterized protein LOC124200411 isoform X2 n=1 Tax=Daphnia pulex TaxID=6669 RepID=UPI001EE10022|nr:uncharacterized protein LOC124200411 isoform X2 [Daphnia pulex]
MIIHHLLLIAASFVASIQGGRNCGTHPSLIYLQRGDKSSVEYWVPPPETPVLQAEPEMSLQSRLDELEEEEENVPSSSTQVPAVELSTTGGLTTWRTNDEEFGEWRITTSSMPSIKDESLTVSSQMPILADSINVAESKQQEEESTGFTGLKVSSDDVITTTPLATATSQAPHHAPQAHGVNGHIPAPETNGNNQLSDATEFPAVDVTEPQTDGPLVERVADQQQQFRPEEEEQTTEVAAVERDGGSRVAPVEKIFTTESTPEEINMEPITNFIQLLETKTKAELLENLMKEENLRPHTSRPEVSAKNNESITVENSDLLHPVTTEAHPPPPPPTTQEPTEMATDSIQIEITKHQQTKVDSAPEESITSQLKDDFQDIAHILMSIPELPKAENQVKEVENPQTEEPESVTIADFKSDLHSAIDIHAEEVEPVTVSEEWLAKITGSQTEVPELFSTEAILPIRMEESSVQSMTKQMEPEEDVTTEETISVAGLSQSDGSGMNPVEDIIPPSRSSVHMDHPELKVEGSGLSDAIQEDPVEIFSKIDDGVEGSGLNAAKEISPMGVVITEEPELKKAEENGPIENLGTDGMENPFLVKIETPIEGSGSLLPISDESIAVVDRSDDPASAVVEDESPPEFRNDDVLINRIRTIVNSLTNPKDSSSSFLRRTSGLLQSVFKRTKRSTNPAEVVNSPAFRQFLRSQPLPIRRALSPNFSGRFSRQMVPSNSGQEEEDGEECDLHIKTDPGLHLLLTFHNMSAPYTLDCAGAYVEIEREGNGFEARWCGKPIGERGVRSHVIFARSEVRVSVYNNKNTLLKQQFVTGVDENNSLDPQPFTMGATGFSADIEVIDLHDAGQFTSFQRSEAYSNVHRRIG